MKLHFPLPLVVLVLMGLFITIATASNRGVAALEVIEVSPGVFVHRGRNAGLDDPGRRDSANVGFIVGERCVAVIDSGGALETGQALLASVQAKTARPICYVINTHVHFDHVLGNAAFRDSGAIIVGHRNLAEALAANREFFVEEFPAEVGPEGTAAIVAPSLLVEGEETIDLGNRVLLLVAHPPAHTSNDLTVLDVETGTLFSGDLVFIERLPILGASLKGWLAWMARQRSMTYARVVPGHGPASAPWPEAVQPQLEYFEALLAQTRKAVADGMFLEDALESIGKDRAKAWQLSDRHPRNVSRAFRELEWE